MSTLVTVATDGFRDYVDLPDGRTFNMGSVSVLKLITSLVPSGALCRQALNNFLKTKHATISVDLTALEVLLRPKRSRWAGHENRLIPSDPQNLLRGASTMNPDQVQAQIFAIETHLAQLGPSGDPKQGEKLATLQQLVTGLVGTSTGTITSEGFYGKLASIETMISKIDKGKGLTRDTLRTLQHFTASLNRYAKSASTTKEGAVDEQAKTELSLYMDNEGRLDRQKQSILQNILRKMKSGKYEHNLIWKLWMYWVDEGAKMYVKEFGGDTKTLFPKPLREELAKEYADDEKKKIEDGEYSHIKVAVEQGQDEQEAPEGQDKTAAEYPGDVSATDPLYFKVGIEKAKQSEEKESRFEEGKPADPTENMSKEDAAEWKKQTEENKDNFKSAADDEKKLQCDMEKTCKESVTYVDNDGYVYCTKHGERRKASQPCRKLRPAEIKKLESGGTIKYASLDEEFKVEASTQGSGDNFKSASDTTKGDWEKALKTDEDLLVKMESAVKLLEGGKQVPGDPHWSIDQAKKGIESLKEAIKNKKQLISKFAGSLSLEEQLKLLKTKPPQKVKDGEMFVVKIFSPVVKKYIPMSEHKDEGEADEGLAVWEADHKRILKALGKATVEEPKTAGQAVITNEALATSVMTKVEAALQAVGSSVRTNTEVAKMDLHTISSKLASMLHETNLSEASLQPQLLDLAGKADTIQTHFAATAKT